MYMSERPYLSVIIPAYNEAERISNTLLAIDKYLSHQPYPYEILVVVDGAKDNTAEVVRKFSTLIKNLSIIDNKENKGKGAVVAQGMLAAHGEARLFMDADNSTSIDQVANLLPFFSQGYDVVIGSRRVKGSKIAKHQGFVRELAGRIGNLIIQIFAVPGVRDTQCGFKAFSAKAAEDIFKRLTITRWGFDVEILAVARQLGYKIKQVPIIWINDEKSHVGTGAFVEVLIDTLKVRLNIWRGLYK